MQLKTENRKNVVGTIFTFWKTTPWQEVLILNTGINGFMPLKANNPCLFVSISKHRQKETLYAVEFHFKPLYFADIKMVNLPLNCWGYPNPRIHCNPFPCTCSIPGQRDNYQDRSCRIQRCVPIHPANGYICGPNSPA